jgi:hypothetical protein
MEARFTFFRYLEYALTVKSSVGRPGREHSPAAKLIDGPLFLKGVLETPRYLSRRYERSTQDRLSSLSRAKEFPR